MIKKTIQRWLPLLILAALLALFFIFRLDKYLSFSSLRDHRLLLLSWTESHFILSSLIFIICYTLAVAISIPGAVFLTLAGGFLFGAFYGVILVVFSATLGATLLFFAVRTALGENLAKRAKGWVSRMQQGLQQNAFYYLLSLRLIPLFPFWVVNIVPALLNVSTKTFVAATFLGIIPGTIIYVLVGNGLGQIFAANQTPNLGIIFAPQILGPLLALAGLSLLPLVYKLLHSKRKTKDRYDLAIIGAGAGGLSLAAGCSQLGLKVILIEAGKMGGDCLNYGCVPSKSLLAAAKSFYHLQQARHLGVHAQAEVNFPEVMQHVQAVIANIAEHDSVKRFEALGVNVIQAPAKFIEADTLKAGSKVIHAKHFAIASGSTPFIPNISGLDEVNYLTNETIFDLKAQPEHLIIIGGGPIGCELAQAFAMLGSKVTIIEMFNILPKDDVDCVAVIRDEFAKLNIKIYENIKVQAVKASNKADIVVLIEHNDKTLEITGSHLLIATGRRAAVTGLDLEAAGVKYTAMGITVNRRLQTSNKKIYAIGDVTGPYQFTHMANYQAGIVLRNIVFKWPAKVNYQAVPWVTYTEPELAHVGLLATAAKDRKDLKILEIPFIENDRAQTERTLKGKIKIITDKKARILGVTIVGPQAGELILPWVMAIREHKTLRSFTDVIAAYPTLSEISKRVAQEFYIPKLFSNKTRWLVHWLQKF